jgi:hypothetical protein
LKYRKYDGVPRKELQIQLMMLMTKIVKGERMGVGHAMKVLLIDTIHCDQPEKYRKHMPDF